MRRPALTQSTFCVKAHTLTRAHALPLRCRFKKNLKANDLSKCYYPENVRRRAPCAALTQNSTIREEEVEEERRREEEFIHLVLSAYGHAHKHLARAHTNTRGHARTHSCRSGTNHLVLLEAAAERPAGNNMVSLKSTLSLSHFRV